MAAPTSNKRDVIACERSRLVSSSVYGVSATSQEHRRCSRRQRRRNQARRSKDPNPSQAIPSRVPLYRLLIIDMVQTAVRRRAINYIRSNNKAPTAMKTQPATREINLANGNTFSNKTSTANAAIHSTFITPPTNSSNIRAQQQPMQ